MIQPHQEKDSDVKSISYRDSGKKIILSKNERTREPAVSPLIKLDTIEKEDMSHGVIQAINVPTIDQMFRRSFSLGLEELARDCGGEQYLLLEQLVNSDFSET